MENADLMENRSPAAASFPAAAGANRLRLLARDYSELVKLRVTSLIVMSAWCGCYLAAMRSGFSSLSWSVFHALLGIGLAAGGTAAINEVMERDIDARMRRTSIRPLVTGRMSLAQATLIGFGMTISGCVYLAVESNELAALLTVCTTLVYLAAYTPLKRVHTICTFIGAFPGAMPPVLGWVAVRGRVEWPALVLFAIVFCWQFPHFHSIAWLYREDYQRAGVRMLPVVETDGRSTSRQIVLYLVGLVIASLAAGLIGMAGRIYAVGALVLGLAFFWFGWRLAAGSWAQQAAESRSRARHLLQASVIYLPILFGLMMLNAT